MSYQQPPQGQPYHQYPPPAAPPPAPKKSRGILRGVVYTLAAITAALVIAAIIVGPDGETPAASDEPATGAPASAAAPAKPAKPAGPARTMSDGVYEVGVDVQAGRYKTPGPPADGMGMCYWSRATNDSGEFEALIANGTPQGPGSVTVKQGEFVELSGGCTWTKAG